MGDPVASQGVRWRIRRLDDVDSTNRYTLDAARDGEPEGLVVVADHQHAGRGRRGRSWSAPPGSSLLVSVLLRPLLAPEQVHVITMAGALALADAVRDVSGVTAGLKWPNDLVVGDRKLAGLLAEADLRAGAVAALVLGIGCNVRWPELPPELRDIATTIELEADRPVRREELLAALLDRFGTRLDNLDAVPADYRARLSTLGRAVRVELVDGSVDGLATDVDPRGALVVTGDDGARLVVTSADVVHLRDLTGPGPTRSGRGTLPPAAP